MCTPRSHSYGRVGGFIHLSQRCWLYQRWTRVRTDAAGNFKGTVNDTYWLRAGRGQGSSVSGGGEGGGGVSP